MSNKTSSRAATSSVTTSAATTDTTDTTNSTVVASAAPNVSTELINTLNQEENALAMSATAATALREAISSSLPVSSTQLMTVQVPGTIIDLT
jgi:ABC-type xylose transport system substrate-binding protein